jgi:hypothetical protein
MGSRLKVVDGLVLRKSLDYARQHFDRNIPAEFALARLHCRLTDWGIYIKLLLRIPHFQRRLCFNAIHSSVHYLF